jgi:hypothetical protein
MLRRSRGAPLEVCAQTPEAAVKTPKLHEHATIGDVIAALREVGEALPAGDGFRHFNDVYLLVTEAVAARVAAGDAHDPEYLVLLDVLFCQLYFDALAAGDDAPRAWQPMLGRRHRTSISGLRFAVAGMNAHINRDLAVALDLTCRRIGSPIHDDDARHRDFRAVDDLLLAHMAGAKDRVQTPLQEILDDSLGSVDDAVQHFSIRHARQVAWENGQYLHRLRDQPTFHSLYLRNIDRAAGLVGRLLLL